MSDSHNAVKLIERLNALTRELMDKMDVEKSEQLDLDEIKELYLERGNVIDSLEEFAHTGGEGGADLWSDLDEETREKARRLYNETMELAEYVEKTLDEHLTALENKQSGQDYIN